ncbi:stromal membrane-associated protein 1-like isoform X2 [Ostrea edulis]|uniref:stromal membrane-associated protein 1-like isoform X2 n=1 Tax=Ostrea edulis TaxID=37623 RepID=UPI0024AEC5B6|nr:stromal membrane-associated protein 1-like isoform X2 [Ostrea edulis]
MSTRLEKEKAKAQQEKFQAVLSNLLKDDDNKYCVDCDAKGPRWASWNLGIFLCIRCAGIHRNLGVHLSKVKSVNLDTWTAEQVSMMMEMGNSRGRAVYEANIPDGYRRPQTDSSLEAFIRAKYEQKKYIAREWVPPKVAIPKELKTDRLLEDEKADKKKRQKQTMIQLSTVPKTKPPESSATSSPKKEPAPITSQATSSSSNDLLGLETPVVNKQNTSGSSNDLLGGLGDLIGAPVSSQTGSTTQTSQPLQSTQQNGETELNLFQDSGSEKPQDKSTKASIMALFGSSSSQQPQQQFGVPGSIAQPYDVYQYEAGGVYMPQQNLGMYGMPQNSMMAPAPNMQYQQQMGMMNMPQQQHGMYNMMGVPPGSQAGYGNQQQMQQMQYQQMQQQMAQMRLGNGNVGVVGAPMGNQGAMNWGAPPNNGQTLSTNLWK